MTLEANPEVAPDGIYFEARQRAYSHLFRVNPVTRVIERGFIIAEAGMNHDGSLGNAGRQVEIVVYDNHSSSAESVRAFQRAVSANPLLIATAILTIYIVLGVLYESYVHPLTILSTLPSAGVGALLAFDTPAEVMANQTVQIAYLGEPL